MKNLSVTSKKKYVITAQNSPKNLVQLIEQNGYNVLYGDCLKSVTEPIQYHTDVQVCYAGNKDYVCCPECYDYYANLFNKTSYNLICGDTYLSAKYPYDCAYNVAVTGKFAIGNFKYTDTVLKTQLEKNKITLINVKQGYCKCNICIVDENSIITSDNGICNAAKAYMQVCFISADNIQLDGFDNGFIGGASGCDNESIYFCGDIKNHNNYNKILAFINKCGKNIKSSENILTDIGTILFLG